MNEPKPVLILVDGFRFGPSNLLLVSRYYESIGFIVERVPFVFNDILSIETYGMHATECVVDVAKRYPDHKRFLLAYSMGGLAALDAIKNDGIAPLLDGVASFGTPYRGSFLATASAPLGYVWPLVSQLRLLSPYLRRLQGRRMPEGLPYTSFAGAMDVICPPPLCRLKNAENITVAGGHTSFMYRTDLLDRIALHLRK